MAVVFGTTLRPDSEVLAEVAALLAERMHMPLRLVHVCEDPRAPLVVGTDQEFVLGSVRDDLERQAEQLRTSIGATVRAHLASGPVVGALASLSEFELATVLLVGSSSRRSHFTAERLSRSSWVPLIVLREPARLSAWLRGTKPLRILVGADLGRTAEAARAFAAHLATLGPTEVEVLYVASPEETHARLHIDPERTEGELSPDVEATLLRELEVAAPESESSATLRVLSGRGRADAHLVARADGGHFDLVVVGHRRRSIAQQIAGGSIVRGILQASPVSVACVPLSLIQTDVSFRPPRIVVVGMHLTDEDDRTVAHAVGYAEGGATMHLAHVLDTTGADAAVREARDEAWYRLSKAINEDADEHTLLFETHVLEGRPAEQLVALSERLGADLLVVGGRSRPAVSRALLGSVARALVQDSHIPVLIVPARRP